MIRLARHSLALAKRNLIGVVRNPEALLDVTLQPIIFIALFTYVFGGAIAARLAARLPAVPAPRHPRPDDRLRRRRDRRQPQHRHREGRLRPLPQSLPIARAAPLVGAVLADVVRYVLLCVVTLGFGYVLGFRAQHRARSRCSPPARWRSRFALCLCWVSVFVGMLARTPGAVQGILILLLFPLTFGTSTFVPADTLPDWLQSFDRRQPAHPPRRRAARADARRPGGQRPALDARLDGRPAGGLRPARATGLPAPRLTRPRRRRASVASARPRPYAASNAPSRQRARCEASSRRRRDLRVRRILGAAQRGGGAEQLGRVVAARPRPRRRAGGDRPRPLATIGMSVVADARWRARRSAGLGGAERRRPPARRSPRAPRRRRARGLLGAMRPARSSRSASAVDRRELVESPASHAMRASVARTNTVSSRRGRRRRRARSACSRARARSPRRSGCRPAGSRAARRRSCRSRPSSSSVASSSAVSAAVEVAGQHQRPGLR